MPKRIYVGNLPFSATDDEVRNLVGRYGKLASVRIDSAVAVVEAETQAGASRALSGLTGGILGGRKLQVSEGRPRSQGESPFGWPSRRRIVSPRQSYAAAREGLGN